MKLDYEKLNWMNAAVNRFDNELFNWFLGLSDEDFEKLRRVPFPKLARLLAKHADNTPANDDEM